MKYVSNMFYLKHLFVNLIILSLYLFDIIYSFVKIMKKITLFSVYEKTTRENKQSIAHGFNMCN